MKEIIVVLEAQYRSYPRFAWPLFKEANGKLEKAGGYSIEEQRNVKANYQIVTECMEEALRSFPRPDNLEELVRAINRNRSCHTPEIGEIISLEEKSYEVRSFFPPNVPFLKIIKNGLFPLVGTNQWDLLPSCWQAFLPITYGVRRLS